jgi:Domain of unknown function (DUF1905)
MERFEFQAVLWIWKGDAPAAWHFITLPSDIGTQVKFFAGKGRGFGSVVVKAVIGETSWKTSLFPDTKTGSYLLPVKAAVRKSENILAGDNVRVRIDIEV